MSAPVEHRVTGPHCFHHQLSFKLLDGGRNGYARKSALLLIAAVALLLPPSTVAAPPKEVRRVLIFNVYNPLASPGVALMDQAIVAGLQEAPYQIELYSEEMESALFPDETSQREFREWYVRKYRDRKPDVIIAVGPDPLRFLAESHEQAFPNIPIIFCGSTEEMLDEWELDAHFTGVWGTAAPDKTLEAALRLQPSTKHIVVVGGVSSYDRKLESITRASLRKYESKLDVTYLTDLDMPTLLDRLRHLPSNTIVYHTSIMQDVAGSRFIDASQSVPMVASASNAPVFVVDDVDIGKGTVGGNVLSFAAQGEVAATMAVRVLNGERPREIPVVKSANVYMFDWRAMKRWGLKEGDLPPGSIILYRQRTLWEAFKRYIVGCISLIMVETLLILGLLWQRARRRKAESELAITNDRLRLAVESGGAVGWDWNLTSGHGRRFGDLQTIFGIPAGSSSGKIEDLRGNIHPADQAMVSSTIDDAIQTRKPYAAEFRVVRPDGSVRWITARGKVYYSHHSNAERMVGMGVDITERKQMEEELHASEEKLAGIVASAMDAIIAVDEEQRIVLFNNAAEKMFGCTVDDAIGSVISRFIPQRLHSRHEAHVRRFAASGVTNRAMDASGEMGVLWAVRTNGEEFPIEASISHVEAYGKKLFTVIVRDITERKMAEKALTSLSGRLIEAQEEERRRIAREIHDDYNQRLAVLAIDLEELAENIGNADVGAGRRLHEHWNQICELGADLHVLSHRLHSSTLENLGLVAGAKAFCEEFTGQQEIQVDFTYDNLPSGISGDVALCLFRILQEGLRNVKKHSGADRAEVRLEVAGDKLHLSIFDHGRGFDSKVSSSQTGIGIRSMEERLRLLGGNLQIHTRPMEGTKIDAWLPITTSGHEAS